MPSTNANKIERSELFNTLFSEAEERNEFHAAGVKIEIAEQIFRMMEKRNMTQADLARKLGKNRAYVSKILKGNTNFTIETLVLIARSLEAEWDFQLVTSC
ncbi:MAG: helix-turn-helix protein [Bacteroidetes bacterium ADurb.Bin302]|nr:MAG: helix-turn-helix protein [Bacteroidetes bacterium ADurb.Bin302]